MTTVSMLVTPGPRSDCSLLRPVLGKVVDHGAVIGTVIGDKGYDSEANRRFVVLKSMTRRTYRCAR
jgi:hypothetical protein